MSSEVKKEIATAERFTNRVGNYVRHRPDYPKGVVQFLKSALGLSSSSIIADVGSGTGISSKLFLDKGCTVFGVEPNEAMRSAAEDFLKTYANFKSVNGSAEATNLPDQRVDFVVAGQAYHWFDADKAKAEFRRILKPSGWTILIWNERQLDTTEFLRDYEKFLLEFGTDYKEVRHDNYERLNIEKFFASDFNQRTFANFQEHDFEGLKGRLLSASYIPSEGHKRYEEMIDELQRLFAKHKQDGKVKILYDTNVYYGRV